MSKQVSNPEYESSHYDYPIPSREAIRAVLTTQPMAVGEIAEKLQIENWAQEAIAKRLGAMCRDQQIEKSKEGFSYRVNLSSLKLKCWLQSQVTYQSK